MGYPASMSPEAQIIWLGLALIAFIVGALVSWYPDRRGYVTGVFWACTGLALATVVPLWTAIQAS